MTDVSSDRAEPTRGERRRRLPGLRVRCWSAKNGDHDLLTAWVTALQDWDPIPIDLLQIGYLAELNGEPTAMGFAWQEPGSATAYISFFFFAPETPVRSKPMLFDRVVRSLIDDLIQRGARRIIRLSGGGLLTNSLVRKHGFKREEAPVWTIYFSGRGACRYLEDERDLPPAPLGSDLLRRQTATANLKLRGLERGDWSECKALLEGLGIEAPRFDELPAKTYVVELTGADASRHILGCGSAIMTGSRFAFFDFLGVRSDAPEALRSSAFDLLLSRLISDARDSGRDIQIAALRNAVDLAAASRHPGARQGEAEAVRLRFLATRLPASQEPSSEDVGSDLP